jgi:hypothetical protein
MHLFRGCSHCIPAFHLQTSPAVALCTMAKLLFVFAVALFAQGALAHT